MNKIIAEFPKNSKDVVRVQLTTLNGYDLADIRTYYPDPVTGEMKPGTQGISIRRELLPVLLDALHRATAEAGVLPDLGTGERSAWGNVVITSKPRRQRQPRQARRARTLTPAE